MVSDHSSDAIETIQPLSITKNIPNTSKFLLKTTNIICHVQWKQMKPQMPMKGINTCVQYCAPDHLRSICSAWTPANILHKIVHKVEKEMHIRDQQMAQRAIATTKELLGHMEMIAIMKH